MSFHPTDVFQMASDMPFYYGNHKFNILAAILNSTWEPGRVFVTSFHPRDFSQMASDMPFNYHKLLKVTTTFRISSLWGLKSVTFRGSKNSFTKLLMNELFWFYEIKKKTQKFRKTVLKTWNAILHSSSNLCCCYISGFFMSTSCSQWSGRKLVRYHKLTRCYVNISVCWSRFEFKFDEMFLLICFSWKWY